MNLEPNLHEGALARSSYAPILRTYISSKNDLVSDKKAYSSKTKCSVATKCPRNRFSDWGGGVGGCAEQQEMKCKREAERERERAKLDDSQSCQ